MGTASRAGRLGQDLATIAVPPSATVIGAVISTSADNATSNEERRHATLSAESACGLVTTDRGVAHLRGLRRRHPLA